MAHKVIQVAKMSIVTVYRVKMVQLFFKILENLALLMTQRVLTVLPKLMEVLDKKVLPEEGLKQFHFINKNIN